MNERQVKFKMGLGSIVVLRMHGERQFKLRPRMAKARHCKSIRAIGARRREEWAVSLSPPALGNGSQRAFFEPNSAVVTRE
jgi:hypothetical protein